MDIKCVVICYGLKDGINVSQVFLNKADARRLFESKTNDGWLYVLNYSRTQPISDFDGDPQYMTDGEFGDIKLEHRSIAVKTAISEFIKDDYDDYDFERWRQSRQ